MLTSADIRAGDLAWGMGLALLATSLSIAAWDGGDHPPMPPPPTAAIPIRTISALPSTASAAAHDALSPSVSGTLSRTDPPSSRAPTSHTRRTSHARRTRSARDLPSLQDSGLQPSSDPPVPASRSADDLDSVVPASELSVEGDGPLDATGDDDGAAAVGSYRAALARWFADRFHVRGTGLPPSELSRLRASADVVLDDERRIADYTLRGSGNDAFDAAAVSTLESLRGVVLPPPPADYPGAVQSTITITFICKPSTCD